MTELMPPNYGIVDHVAFYHSDVVEGPLPQAIGEVVDCEGIPNVDGGKYEWRLVKVSLSRTGRVRSITQQSLNPSAIMTSPYRRILIDTLSLVLSSPVKFAPTEVWSAT